MKKSPLTITKERFGDKAGLIKAVRELASDDLWLDRLNTDKGFDCVSNAKLIHLHEVLSAVKSEFGSRSKLIDAIMQGEKRTDEGYRTRLSRFSTPRLWDDYRALSRRLKKAS